MSDISYQWPPNYKPVPPKAITAYHLLDVKGLDELNYLKAVHQHLILYLAGRYRAGEYVEIGHLCDDDLDQSGRLLGEVREIARR